MKPACCVCDPSPDMKPACYVHDPFRPTCLTPTDLSTNLDVELSDTLQGELLFLHQDLDGITHEALGNLQHIRGHCGRQ